MQEQQSRQQVIEAADRLFYARGIQAVSMDDLRSAAAVPLKRMYTLFPSKESIVEAVLENRTAQWAAGIEAAAAGASDARGRLLAIYDFLEGWFDQDDFRGCAFINSYGELGAISPAVVAVVRAQKQSFQEYVSRLVAEAGAPASLAPQLALLAEGAQTTAAISGNADAAAHARAAADILIGVALAPR